MSFNKKYKIVLAADLVTQGLQTATQSMQSAVSDPNSLAGAGLSIPLLFNQFQLFFNQAKQQEESQNLEKKKEEALKYFQEQEDAINKLSSRTGQSPEFTANFIENLAKIDPSDPTKSKIAREEIYKAVNDVLTATDGMGLENRTLDIFEYFKKILAKTRTPASAASKVADDVKSMKELSDDSGLAIFQIFEIYYNAVMSDDFSQIYAMVSVLPLLGKNLFSLKGKIKIDVTSMNKFTQLAQNMSGVNLSLSAQGKIAQIYNQSMNDLKVKWQPIRENLQKSLLASSIKWNQILGDDFVNNPNKWQAIRDFHNQFAQQILQMNNQWKQVDLPTNAAPGAPMQVKSSVRKIKIVVAQNTSAPSSPKSNKSNEIVTLDLQSIELLKNDIASKEGLLKELEKQVDQSLSMPDTQQIGGDFSLNIFKSAFGPDQGLKAATDILSIIQNIRSNSSNVMGLYKRLMSSPGLPAVLFSKIQQDFSETDKDIVATENDLLTLEAKVKFASIILPELRNLQFDLNVFSDYKESIGVFGDYPTVQLTDYTNGELVYLTKAEAIGYTLGLGFDIAERIKQMGDAFSSGPSQNFKDSAKNIYVSANTFRNKLLAWQKQTVMKDRPPQMSENPV